MRRYGILLAVLALSACGGGTSDNGQHASGEAHGLGPAAAYERRLLFVAPGGDPRAAEFEFALVDDSTALYRSARVTVIADTAWRTLVDTAWTMAPMREPWRLVPLPGLRLIMGEDDELEALVHHGEPETRLELHRSLGEYSPDGGTRMQLRDADLVEGSASSAGVVLDIQLGRSITSSSALQALVAAGGATLAAPLIARLDVTTPSQTRAEALLVGQGVMLSVGTNANGPVAWLEENQQEDLWEGAHLVATSDVGPASSPGEPDWRLVRGSGDVAGELQVVSDHVTDLRDAGDLHGSLGVNIVRGWIETHGERRDVVGIVRYVRG
jgi:hypothetical protein